MNIYKGIHAILNKFDEDLSEQLYDCYCDGHISNTQLMDIYFNCEEFRNFTDKDNKALQKWLKLPRWDHNKKPYELSFTDKGCSVTELVI